MLAFYAPAIFFDGVIQKSTLDVFLICVALWLITRTTETTINAKAAKTAKQDISLRPSRSLRLSSWLWLGIAMGLLALTRENAMVLIAVVGLWTLISNPEPRIPNPVRVRRAAAFLAGVALVLLPVAARKA